MTTIRNKAVNYAEENLLVHKVYEEAQALEAELSGPEGLLVQQTGVTNSIRDTEMKIEDRLTILRIEERNDKHEMSATAFEAHLKVVIANDEYIAELRNHLNSLKFQSDSIGAEIREKELAHRSRVSRMNVLGGYLQYLAAAKNSNTQARANATDWPF